ncbi:MAG TPA: hypothetical protein VHI78_05430 [Bacteroidales bacterium]|jgi:hypothetical protein|nr:hypothetical protein [Bacteroidales bacterium]
MRSFFTDNVNSILGAISLHLLVVIAFLGFKLGNMEEMQKEQILIEFNEETLPPEEEKRPEEMNEEAGDEYLGLDQRELHSIASNAASKLDKEISTSDYEKQVMEELGISSLEAPGKEMEQQVKEKEADENAIEQKTTDEAKKQDNSVPNVIRKENTTVSYFLEGRWHNYLYIPTYKCQGGGTVYLDIIIDQSGKVISAMIQENKSTADPCLREEAYHSAVSARFNPDRSASSKQLGSITYVFLAQ